MLKISVNIDFLFFFVLLKFKEDLLYRLDFSFFFSHEILNVKLEVEETIVCEQQESEQVNKVTKVESEAEAIETRKLILQLHKAPFGKI